MLSITILLTLLLLMTAQTLSVKFYEQVAGKIQKQEFQLKIVVGIILMAKLILKLGLLLMDFVIV